MTRRVLVAVLALTALAVPLAAQDVGFKTGDAELDTMLNSINVEASTDVGSFTTQLSADFGARKQAQLQWMRAENLQPGEVYLLLELSRIAGKLPEDVLQIYEKNRGKGWGAAIRALGIKPASPKFNALKAAAAERCEKTKVKEKTMHEEMDEGRSLAMGAFKSGDAGLDANLNMINSLATADLGFFTTQLSADFGVKLSQLQAWMEIERLLPAEVYLILELGGIARKPPAAVLEVYKNNKGQGWGVVLQALGIKPDSAEFKALGTAASARNDKLEGRK